MIRMTALVLALLAAGAAGAQTVTRVCETLDTRIAQSPANLEGRILNEALFEAAALDCPQIAHSLLESGASVEARNRFGGTPVNVAAGRGSREIVAMLLERGADLITLTLAYNTTAGRRSEITATHGPDLIAAGADVNHAEPRGRHAGHGRRLRGRPADAYGAAGRGRRRERRGSARARAR